MVIGRVVGRLWATRKDEKLNGQKFLIVRLLKDIDVEET
ncbi:MAG TPA: ethanolamine utilization protein EutN, partial [Clostridium sp.]|nr:ethanolamine utilization protein EutN [Clostridium sp.]